MFSLQRVKQCKKNTVSQTHGLDQGSPQPTGQTSVEPQHFKLIRETLL